MKIVIGLAVGLFLAVQGFAAEDPAYRTGRAAMSKNDADGAVAAFEQAVARQPNNADYHFWLGSAYGNQAMKASLFKQASLAKKTKEEFERAVELDPNHVEARLGLVDYYLLAPGFMGGGEDKAQAQANELRKRDALAGHRAWARIYSHAKKPEQARAEMVTAVREQPASPKAHYYLGLQYMSEKNYAASLVEFEQAAKLTPPHAPALFRIAQSAALGATNLPRGEEAARQYLAHTPGEDDPPLARAWYWLGMVLEKQGKRADAKSAYVTSLKLTPGAKDVTEALKRVS